MKKFCMTLVTLAVALSGTAAFAKDKKDHEKGWERHREERKEARKDDRREHWQQREAHHHEREHHKVFARQNEHRPPGWNHGKKVGWGNCDVPPGQAKKVGCHPRQHYAHHRRPPEPRVVRVHPPVRTAPRQPRARVSADGHVQASVN
jgi:hypothetical protein